jgi:hypothetical protein
VAIAPKVSSVCLFFFFSIFETLAERTGRESVRSEEHGDEKAQNKGVRTDTLTPLLGPHSSGLKDLSPYPRLESDLFPLPYGLRSPYQFMFITPQIPNICSPSNPL